MPSPVVPTPSDRPRMRTRPGYHCTGHVCPHCQSDAVAYSRSRVWLERVVGEFTSLRAYRCMDCWHRFYGLRRQANAQTTSSA